MYPQLRYMFSSLQSDVTFEDLLKTQALKEHVDKVREVVEMLLQKIHDIDDFVNTLLDLGRQHHMLGAEQQYATVRFQASFHFYKLFSTVFPASYTKICTTCVSNTINGL